MPEIGFKHNLFIRILIEIINSGKGEQTRSPNFTMSDSCE